MVISVRQPHGKRGATVCASKVDSNDGEEVWEVDLGVPPAGNVFIDNNNLNVVTANSDLFQIGRDKLKLPVLNEATARVPSASLPVLTDSVDLGNGVRVFLSSTSPEQIVIFDASSSALKLVNLDLSGDEPTALPIGYNGQLIVPAASGAVYIIDPLTGKSSAHEFQPPLRSGQRVDWPRPVVVNDEIILPDGAGQVYRVSLESQPQPHLAAVGQSATDFKPIGSMAAAGETVYGIRSGISSDDVVAINASDLTSSTNHWALDRRVAWGPETVGDFVMVSSDSGELLCLDAGQNEAWRIKLPHGAIAGPPIVVGDQFLITAINGIVSKLDGKTGQELGQFDVGEPIGSGVTQYGGRSITLGSDGTLHVFQMQ
jgi:outer membrane protein assembly factor BamB